MDRGFAFAPDVRLPTPAALEHVSHKPVLFPRIEEPAEDPNRVVAVDGRNLRQAPPFICITLHQVQLVISSIHSTRSCWATKHPSKDWRQFLWRFRGFQQSVLSCEPTHGSRVPLRRGCPNARRVTIGLGEDRTHVPIPTRSPSF